MSKETIVVLLVILWLMCLTMIYTLKDSKAPTTKTDILFILFVCVAESLNMVSWLMS